LKTFDLSGPSRFPRAKGAGKFAVVAAGAAAFSWAMLTAGPGNGYQVPKEPIHVTLPTVVIVGRREAPLPEVVASAAKSAPSVSLHADAAP
jgi:hypothetical protein